MPRCSRHLFPECPDSWEACRDLSRSRRSDQAKTRSGRHTRIFQKRQPTKEKRVTETGRTSSKTVLLEQEPGKCYGEGRTKSLLCSGAEWRRLPGALITTQA